MEAMYVKAVHDGTIRRLSVSPTDCEGLCAAVAAAFDLPTPSEVAFTWEDDEGDAVALATDADVDEARRVGGGLLRLKLTPVGAPTTTTDRAAPKAAAAVTARQVARAAAVAAAQQQARGARVAKKADAKAARAVRAAAAKEVKAAAGREAKAARQAAAAAAKAERLAAHAEGKAANRRAVVAARQAAKAAAAATDGEAMAVEGGADGAAGGGRRGGRGGGRRGGRDGQVPNWGAAYFSPGGLGLAADAGAAGGAPPTAAPLCGGGMDAAAAALYSIPAVAMALATAGRGRGFWHAECARRGVGAATDAAAAVAMRAVAAAGVGPVSRAVVAALDGDAGRAFVASAAAGGEAGAAAGGPWPSSPVLDADAVDGAAGALEEALLDESVSADDAAAITAGVRAVLAERLVVKAIRYMAAATATADGASDEAVAAAVATALATHPPRTRCGRCGVSPIVGTRYRPAADADAADDADLCGRCYDAAPPAAGCYEALPHPWLAAPAYARPAADGDAAAVPPAPIRFYARGPRVAHLQAVLIAGGHLSPRQVAGTVGWYGPATRGAVAGVQQAAGVAGRVREVGTYDARTRAVLLEAVKNPSGAPAAVPARDAMDVAQVPSQV